MNEAIPPSPAPGPAPRPSNRNRNLLLGAGGAILLLCCCCLILAGVVLGLDPLGWRLLDRLQGRTDAVAASVPADTQIYIAMDALALRSDKMDNLLKAFADSPAFKDAASVKDATDKLDKSLDDALGMNFSDDILPWIGQYAGFTVSDISYETLRDTKAKVAVLVEARDKTKADAFVTRFIEAVSQKSDTTFSDSDYKGVTLHTQEGGPGEPLVVARSGGLVVFANDPDAIRAVIDTQKGNTKSLSSVKDYQAVQAQLPRGRLLTVFMGGDSLANLIDQYQRSIRSFAPALKSGCQTGIEGVRGVGLAVSVVDEGVRVDSVVAYDDARLTDTQRQVLKASDDASKTGGLLPQEALIYAAGQRPDLLWNSYRDATIACTSQKDFDDAMKSAERQIGLNPDKDLFPYLKGDWALALVPDKNSAFAKSKSGDFGFILLAKTSDEKALNQAAEQLNAAAGKGGGLTVEAKTVAGIDGYAVNSFDTPVAFYGIGKGYLTLASSAQVFEDVHNGGPALKDADGYKRAWRSFPSGTSPVLYADVKGILELVRDTMNASARSSFDRQAAPYLDPVQTVALGATPVRNSMAHAVMVVFISRP